MASENQITCFRCDEALEDFVYLVRCGFWDAEKQGFEKHPGARRSWCQECWNDDRGRPNGAHFFPDSAQHLYDVLEAADATLAGIPCWWTGRPSIRVVGGRVEAAGYKSQKTDGGKIEFVPTRIEGFDRDEFDEVADPPEERGLVRLVDAERTPFAEVGEA